MPAIVTHDRDKNLRDFEFVVGQRLHPHPAARNAWYGPALATIGNTVSAWNLGEVKDIVQSTVNSRALPKEHLSDRDHNVH
jgi:hypothetical protein